MHLLFRQALKLAGCSCWRALPPALPCRTRHHRALLIFSCTLAIPILPAPQVKSLCIMDEETAPSSTTRR